MVPTGFVALENNYFIDPQFYRILLMIFPDAWTHVLKGTNQAKCIFSWLLYKADLTPHKSKEIRLCVLFNFVKPQFCLGKVIFPLCGTIK